MKDFAGLVFLDTLKPGASSSAEPQLAVVVSDVPGEFFFCEVRTVITLKIRHANADNPSGSASPFVFETFWIRGNGAWDTAAKVTSRCAR